MKGSDLDGLHLPVSIPRSINWWTTVTVCPLFKVFPKNPIHHFHITHKPSCLQAQNLHKHCLPFFSWDSLILGRRVCTQAIHGTTVILDKGTRISQWCPCETDLCTRRIVTWQMQIFFSPMACLWRGREWVGSSDMRKRDARARGSTYPIPFLLQPATWVSELLSVLY